MTEFSSSDAGKGVTKSLTETSYSNNSYSRKNKQTSIQETIHAEYVHQKEFYTYT